MKKFLVLAMAAVGFLAQSANATVVTFNSAPVAQMATYSESGVNFSINSGVFQNGFNYNGSPLLYFGDFGGQVLTVDMGGATFSLNSFDLAHNHSGDVLTGSNGSTFALPDSCNTAPNYCSVNLNLVFGGAFANLTWFTITTQSHFLFDNLVVNASNASVPAPGALALLGLGLLGIGGLRRKKAA